MAFIIPNAGDTASGQRFVNTNQAEPDSLDIEALGNMRTSCIRSGGEVTYSGSGNTVNVAAGVAILGGIPYSFNASSNLTISTSADPAFSAIVVRLSGSTASVTTLNGASSSLNPTLPKSASTLTGSYTAATDYNPATDVLLATVLRPTVSLASGNIVDKRIMFTGSLHWTQATIPTSTQGNNGDLVTVGTSVYVKAAGSWFQVSSQSVVDEIMPVGGILSWPSLKSPPGVGSRWLECNGQSVSSTSYPLLASARGVSGTFTLPNYNGLFLQGTTSSSTGGVITTNGGASSVSVPLKNHTHTLSGHTHTMSAHDHTASTATSGAHTHTGTLTSDSVTVDNGGIHSHSVSSQNRYVAVQGLQHVAVFAQTRKTAGAGGFSLQIATSTLATNPVPSVEGVELISVGGSGIASFGVGNDALIAAQAGEHSHTAKVGNTALSTGSSGGHTHTVTVDSASATNSGAPSTDATSSVGDGAAPTISTVPPYRAVRYFVRAA